MSSIDLKFLIFAQIGIDIAIVFFIIILIRKLRPLNNGKSLREGTNIFESLLIDADKLSSQLRKELGKKHQLIKGLNDKLDNRIMSLNVLLLPMKGDQSTLMIIRFLQKARKKRF